MKLQKQFYLHFRQQNTTGWSEQDGGIFNRTCLACLLRPSSQDWPGPLTRSKRVLVRNGGVKEEEEVVVVVEVEVVVGDFVVVKMISASVVLGRGLGPAEVFSVFIKPCDSVVSLSLSSLLSSSSDLIRSI